MKTMMRKTFVWYVVALVLTCTCGRAETPAARRLIDVAARQNLQLVAVMPTGLGNQVAGENASGPQTMFDLAKTIGMHVSLKGNLAIFSTNAGGDPNQLGQSLTLPAAKETISCEFFDADIRDLFRVVYRHTGMNMLWHKSLRGRVIVRVSDIEAGLLIEAVAQSFGFAVKQQGNIVYIGEPARMAEMLPPADLKGDGDVSLDFRDADIRDITKIIASRAKNDLVTGTNVRGNVTVSLRDVNVAEAMVGIARANGFDAVLVDGLWIVADPRELPGLIEAWKQPTPTPTTNISLDFRDVGIQGLVQIVSDKGGLRYPALLNPESRVTVRFQDRSADRIQNLLIKLGGGTL